MMRDHEQERRTLVHAVLSELDPKGSEIARYKVRPRALEAATAGPADTVTMADGSPVYCTVAVPRRSRVTLHVYQDDDTHPDMFECYSPDDVDAFVRGDWCYLTICAKVELPDGRTGKDWLSGVDYGDQWPGTLATQVWHVIPDLVAEALRDARQQVPHAL